MEDNLVEFEMAHNSAVNSTTLCSPFYVNYGMHPRTVQLEGLSTNNPSAKSFLDAIHDRTKFIRQKIVKQNTKMVEYANKPRIPHSFNVDEYAWLPEKNLSLEDGSGMRKFNSKFGGPLRISKKINDVTFRLELPTQ